MNDERERRLENLVEATGENTKSKAIDQAARYYVRMAGGCSGVRTGAIENLMQLAVDEGSVTPRQIAECLDTNELPVKYTSRWNVGGENEVSADSR